MNKIVCIGEYGNKGVFYHLDRDVFYIADYNFFDDFETSDDLEFISYSKEQEELLESVRVTDEDIIKEAREVYEEYKKDYEEHQKRLANIRTKINKNKKGHKEKSEFQKEISTDGLIVLGCAIIILILSAHKLPGKIINKYQETLDDYHKEHQNDEEHLGYFMAAIESNSTINGEVKDALIKDFTKLVESNIYISDYFKTDGIYNRLKDADFSNCTVDNYTDLLVPIIFDNNDILSKCVTIQLDECANNREASDLSLMFGSLSTGIYDDLLNDLFVSGNHKFIDSLAKYYHASEKDIKELINILDAYNSTQDAEELAQLTREFNKKLSYILTNYHHNRGRVKNINKYILASQAYEGQFIINNNLFADYIIVTYEDPTYGKYNLYFDSVSGIDVSYSIYYEKLVNLIKEKGNNLDYTDPDCRFLLYMVALSYDDRMYFNSADLLACQTPEDLATRIMNSNFTPDGFVDLKSQLLYAYLTSGDYPMSEVIREMTTPNDDALSMAIYQEVSKCLRIDYAAGRLNKEDYDRHMENINRWVTDDEPGYQCLLDVLNTDDSLFSEFKLYPFSYEFASEDIKKYIYVPDE